MSRIVTVSGMLSSASVPSVYLATPVSCIEYMMRWDRVRRFTVELIKC